MLTQQELDDFRDDILEMLPDECVISYPGSATPDNTGGRTRPDVIAGTFPCRVDPLNLQRDQSLLVGLQLKTQFTYKLTTVYAAPLDNGAKVTVGSSQYEVIAFDVDHSLNVSKRAVLSKLR
jgi:hypothetical protein